MSNLKPPPVYKIILVQLVATGLFAATFLMFSNAIAAKSMLLGGLVSVIPNSYFVVQAFRFRGASNAERVVRSFRKGEAGKIALTIVLFAVVFTLFNNVNEAILITGFVSIQILGILMAGAINCSPVGNHS